MIRARNINHIVLSAIEIRDMSSGKFPKAQKNQNGIQNKKWPDFLRKVTLPAAPKGSTDALDLEKFRAIYKIRRKKQNL